MSKYSWAAGSPVEFSSPEQANSQGWLNVAVAQTVSQTRARYDWLHMGLHEIASEIARLHETVRKIQYQTIVAPDGLPFPPAEFDFLVSARRDLDPFSFLELGRDHAADIVSTLSRNGIEIDELEAILEFGCGCGRITRVFHSLKKAKVYGTDTTAG
jgi:hypothetical protein